MADRKSYFNLQESWPMVLLVGAVAIGILIWWNHRENPSEEGILLNPPETISMNETLPPTKFPPQPLPSQGSKPQTTLTSQAASQKTAAVSSSKPLTIQVHSFQDQVKAQKALDDLRKLGFSAEIIKRDLKEKGVWYRVCIGEFETKKQAEEELAKLKEKYKNSFVIAR